VAMAKAALFIRNSFGVGRVLFFRPGGSQNQEPPYAPEITVD
jgi:hypothetical protein